MDKEKIILYKDMNYYLKREYRYVKKGDFTKARIQRIYIDGIKAGYCPFTVVSGLDQLEKEKRGELATTLLKLKTQLENQKIMEEENKKLKFLEYKKALMEKDFYDLTQNEAKIIGKGTQWGNELYRIHRIHRGKLPIIPKGGKNYYYIYFRLNGIADGDQTLNSYIEIYNRFKGMTYEEIIEDIENIKKGEYI